MRSVAGQSLLLVTAALLGACAFDADYGGTQLRCPSGSPRCPDGQTCVNEVCVASAPGDAPPGDGGPDAGVCDLAARAPDNDGCGAALDLTAAALVAGGTLAYGDTTGYGNDLTPSTLPGCTGAPEPGPDAIYRLALQPGDTVTATLSPAGWTGAIYVTDACTATAACKGGAAAFATATVPITTAGTYYVVVDAPASGDAGCFSLAIAVTR